jgi:hypothetical protein
MSVQRHSRCAADSKREAPLHIDGDGVVARRAVGIHGRTCSR